LSESKDILYRSEYEVEDCLEIEWHY